MRNRLKIARQIDGLPKDDASRLEFLLSEDRGPVDASPRADGDPIARRARMLILQDRSVDASTQLALLDQLEARASLTASAELRWSRAGFEQLFEDAPLAMMLFDAEGYAVYCNPASDALVGYDLLSMYSQMSILSVVPMVNPEHAAFIRRAFSGETVGASGLSFVSAVTGRGMTLTIHAFSIMDAGGKVRYVCAIVSDETERMTLAASLDRSKALFEGVIDAIGDPVVTCSEDGGVLSRNRAAAEVLGVVEPSEAESAIEEIFDRLGASGFDPDRFEELRTVGEELEVRLKLSKGSASVSFGLRVYALPKGREGAFVVVLRDMRSEQARRHVLQASKEQLEQINRELRQMNAAKVEFMNIVSHELRSPLVTIHGYIEMILRGGLGDVTQGQRKGLEVALRNTVALTKQIETLLDFSRLEQGRMKCVLEPVELCGLISKVADTFKHPVERKGLEVELDIPHGEVYVEADRDKIRRVLYLLFDNAVKFTSHGLVGVRVRHDAEGQVTRVTVWDTGVGIGTEYLTSVFETFFQVPKPGGGKERGTGLGLAVAQKLIAGHGSAISVASEPGKGSRFSFELNAASDRSYGR